MKKVFLLLIFLVNACIFSSCNKDELNDLKTEILLTNYGITANPQNGDIYVADANRYNSNQGIAYCFGVDGKKKFEFNTAGLPQHAVFVYSYK